MLVLLLVHAGTGSSAGAAGFKLLNRNPVLFGAQQADSQRGCWTAHMPLCWPTLRHEEGLLRILLFGLKVPRAQCIVHSLFCMFLELCWSMLSLGSGIKNLAGNATFLLNVLLSGMYRWHFVCFLHFADLRSTIGKWYRPSFFWIECPFVKCTSDVSYISWTLLIDALPLWSDITNLYECYFWIECPSVCAMRRWRFICFLNFADLRSAIGKWHYITNYHNPTFCVECPTVRNVSLRYRTFLELWRSTLWHWEVALGILLFELNVPLCAMYRSLFIFLLNFANLRRAMGICFLLLWLSLGCVDFPEMAVPMGVLWLYLSCFDLAGALVRGRFLSRRCCKMGFTDQNRTKEYLRWGRLLFDHITWRLGQSRWLILAKVPPCQLPLWSWAEQRALLCFIKSFYSRYGNLGIVRRQPVTP